MIYQENHIIEYEGISLKSLTLNDALALHEMMSDQYLCDKAGLSPHTHISQTLDFIISTNEDVKKQTQLLYGIFDKEELVGMINLFNFDYTSKSGEYGYFTSSKHVRKGYMRKALIGLSNYLLEHNYFNELNVYVDTSNKASLALAKALQLEEKEISIQEDMTNRSVEMIRFIIKDKIS